MRTTRVGLIGTGFAAEFHATSLRRVAGVPVAITAVADHRSGSAAEFARRHSIPRTHPGVADLLADPDIDVVSVCIPTAFHADVVRDALRAGKHVVCEKPLTGAFVSIGGQRRPQAEYDAAMATLDELADTVAASGKLLMYAENWVFAPALSRLKDLLSVSGGRILDIRAEESHGGSHSVASRTRATAGGGALLTLGAHPIGAALHLKQFEAQALGQEISVVSVVADVAPIHESAAHRAEDTWLVSDWHDVETWANLVIGFSDGTRAVITASFAMLGGARNHLEIYTTNSAFRASISPTDALVAFAPADSVFSPLTLREKAESRAGWGPVEVDGDWLRGYPQEMEHFMDCVANGNRPISDLALARGVLEVVYAGYVSAAEGRRVLLDTSAAHGHMAGSQIHDR